MRDMYGQLPPSEDDLRRCVMRLAAREELSRADLAIIGWSQRQNQIFRVTDGTRTHNDQGHNLALYRD